MCPWSLLYFSHLLHLPPRRTPLYGRQLELVSNMTALEGVDCIFKQLRAALLQSNLYIVEDTKRLTG